nr:MAG TPA: Transcriptional regulator [Caudoviricetes sp.]
MKLIILQLKAMVPKEIENIELLNLHRMINEGVLLLDARYKEPIVIDINSERKHDGKSTKICFVDELDAIKQISKENEALLREKKDRQARTIKKVEKALGFTLFDWQKAYIFEDKKYGAEIRFARRAGKTLAHILRLCLSDGEPIKAKLKPTCSDNNELLSYLGEDGADYHRTNFFIRDLRQVYKTLKEAGGIELREIEF